MQNLIIRVSLMGVLCHAMLVGPAAAQASAQNTAEVAAFVNEPHFCDMLLASTGREDGVSHDYTKGSESALKSLLQSNAAMSIPQAFGYMQMQCRAKLVSASAASVNTPTLGQ